MYPVKAVEKILRDRPIVGKHRDVATMNIAAG
jgi:hypothetical protein